MREPEMGDEWRAQTREAMMVATTALVIKSLLLGEDPRIVGATAASAALDWARDRELTPMIPAEQLATFRTSEGRDAAYAASTGSRERLCLFVGETFAALWRVMGVESTVHAIVSTTLDMAALNPRIKRHADDQRAN